MLEEGEAPVRERAAAALPREHGVEVAVELNEPFVEGEQRAGFQELLDEFDVSRARRRGRRRRRAGRTALISVDPAWVGRGTCRRGADAGWPRRPDRSEQPR